METGAKWRAFLSTSTVMTVYLHIVLEGFISLGVNDEQHKMMTIK